MKVDYYRSDWPEVGRQRAVNRQSCPRPPADRTGYKVLEQEVSGAIVRCIAVRDDFESALYDFPIWYLSMEIMGPKVCLTNSRFENDSLQKAVENLIRRLLAAPPWHSGYVAAKLVEGEPLFDLLVRHEFKIVEKRRIFSCRIGELLSPKDRCPGDEILFMALAEIPENQIMLYREQILTCSRRVFSDNGFTRHFNDPFLLAKRPGIDYILAAMALNFKRIAPDHFLLAVKKDFTRLCGFSVVGEKAGPGNRIFSQLLSAVNHEYRGRGIYGGFTRLIKNPYPTGPNF